VKEQQGQEITEALIRYLQPRRMLLVLDNCEHLPDACAGLSVTLLSQCPKLQILATSQHALGVDGEMVRPVFGLSLPAAFSPTFKNTPLSLKVESLLNQSEAIRLFVERARLVQPTFELTLQNAHFVVDICRRLDGLPLAIELSAARLNVLSPLEISDRLRESYQLLAARKRNGVERHQTMHAAVDWSYRLLSEEERILFNRLSVFRCSFTLAAAEAVCTEMVGTPCPAGPCQGSLLNLLSSLIEKSMLVAEVDPWGRTRYRILEPLRQYGQERLVESGEAEAIRRRHALFFLAVAEEAEPNLSDTALATWLDRLEPEKVNVLAALQWTFEEPGRIDLEKAFGVRLAQALRGLWKGQGALVESLEMHPNGLAGLLCRTQENNIYKLDE
jgi:predicted ATPase